MELHDVSLEEPPKEVPKMDLFEAPLEEIPKGTHYRTFTKYPYRSYPENLEELHKSPLKVHPREAPKTELFEAA